MISFKTFLTERFSHKSEGSKSLITHKMALDRAVKADMFETPKAITLQHIITNPKFRGRGYGHQMMNYITSFADKQKKPVELYADSEDKNVPQYKLEKMYSDHGFKKLNITNSSQTRMRRDPK